MMKKEKWYESSDTMFDRFFHWGMPIMLGVLAALLILAFTGSPVAHAEEEPHFVYLSESEDVIWGYAEADEGWYVRFVYFLQDGSTVVRAVPIETDGKFMDHAEKDSIYICLTLIDTDKILWPEFTVYDVIGFKPWKG